MEPLRLTLLNPEVDVDKVKLRQWDVNRPALQLAGFFKHFDFERLQIVGMVESAYVEMNYDDHGVKMYEKIFQAGIPCMVFCRNLKPADEVIELAVSYTHLDVYKRQVQRGVDKTFIMAQIQIGFRTIIGDKDFAVLIWIHCSGVHI